MTSCTVWGWVIGLSGLLAGVAFWLLSRWESRRQAKEVERLAFHDALTGLPNRRLFLDRAVISFAHAKRSESSVGVVFIDLDRFKSINDSYGHNVGDEVLRAVGARLKDLLRQVDTVGRMSGDEFTLILPGVHTAEDVAKIANKIIDIFHLPMHIGGRDIYITASIGIAIFPENGTSPETLLQRADAAMYKVKKRGGDNYLLYSPDMERRAKEEMDLEARLRLALARNEFLLYYQPRVDATTGRVVAFEALLRWNDPDRGIVSPRDFIQVAELSGLIVPIGQWALAGACRQAARWHAEGCHELFVSVNLSSRQFHRHDLARSISDSLRAAQLEPRYLELEVDESCVMNNAEASMRILHELKAIGVRVLIAHFGAGYSSLRYLRRFPIDGLKLDRSFLAGNGSDDRPLARAALGMAKALSLKVIGEGVETREAADFLRSQACDDIQGFLVSEPVPAQDCARFIHAASDLRGLHSGDELPAG